MYEMYETMPPPPTKIMKMYEEGPSRRESDSKMHEMGGGLPSTPSYKCMITFSRDRFGDTVKMHEESAPQSYILKGGVYDDNIPKTKTHLHFCKVPICGPTFK